MNVAMEMKSDKAWSSRHEFTFTESPVPALKIEKGVIELTLGETDSTKKVFNLYWRLICKDRALASKNFDKLKQYIHAIDTKKATDDDNGDFIQIFPKELMNTGVQSVVIFLGKSPTTKKYEIVVVPGSDTLLQ